MVGKEKRGNGGENGKVAVETREKTLERAGASPSLADSRQLVIVCAANCQLTNKSSYRMPIDFQAYCNLHKMKLQTYSK